MNELLATSIPKLEPYGKEILAHLNQMEDDRKMKLHQISEFVSQRIQNGKSAKLLFVCTHNSRRSIIAQLWAKAAARFFNLENVCAFSGGTEATMVSENALRALTSNGFKLAKVEGESMIMGFWSTDTEGVELFSKIYDHPANPKNDFMAIMVCDDADEVCPVVPGSVARVSLPFADPKIYDGTKDAESKYLETSFAIAGEMLYSMSLVQNALSA